jgi:UDP-N-acetyl-D-galactosamine dehydrogenase
MMINQNTVIGVIGLGYVGLPLAVEFGKKFKVVAFDKDQERMDQISKGIDRTGQLEKEEIELSSNLVFTDDSKNLTDCSVYIVTVPTPVDQDNKPDFSSLEKASEMIGKYLSKDDVVIYESTVYPGATREVCIPILESSSRLEFNKDFFCGYSPERINPGDKVHKLPDIMKVTSGSNPETATFVDDLYKSIIKAGTYKAESIEIAEAAKVIENTQRDINIALINELSMLFDKMDLDTQQVLQAAGTKWNFLNFQPGLVGGHCIGVDPYYLTHKAKSMEFDANMILSGRKVNDGMSKFVVDKFLKKLSQIMHEYQDAKILILGLAFKEDCSDIRNTKVFDVYTELKNKVRQVDIYDPYVDTKEAKEIYGIELIKNLKTTDYDGILLAVPHTDIRLMGVEAIRDLGSDNCILFDLKSVFSSDDSDLRL